MGCDIHVHVEVKRNGQWLHYNAPHVDRNYDLFARLAGVRRYDDSIEPISEPRGLPGDVADLTRAIYEREGGAKYMHSASYITCEEMRDVADWYESHEPTRRHCGSHGFDGVFGYLNGNPIYTLDNGFVDDCRIVFWFDN